jgi:hypothetical protein
MDGTKDDRFFTPESVTEAYRFQDMPGYEWLLDPSEWDRQSPLVLVHAREDMLRALHPGDSDTEILNAFLSLDSRIFRGVQWMAEQVARHSEYPMPALHRKVERWLVARQADPNSIYSYYAQRSPWP